VKGRPPSIKEDDILDAARDVFRAEGHAATTGQIAKRAGVSEGILFYRYKSKEALLAAVIRRETLPGAALRELPARAGTGPLRENIRQVIDLVLDGVTRTHPFIEIALTSPKAAQVREALFHDRSRPPPRVIVELLATYFEAEYRAGRVRKIDALTVAQTMFGGCLEHVREGRGEESPAARKAFTRGLTDLIWHGTVKGGKA
jgi:AcrR family transcriptional regulator